MKSRHRGVLSKRTLAKRKTAPNLRPSQVHSTPSRSHLLSPYDRLQSRNFWERTTAPRPRGVMPTPPLPPEGMDLTGFEPAPATLTGCCASATPQAHRSGYAQANANCTCNLYWKGPLFSKTEPKACREDLELENRWSLPSVRIPHCHATRLSSGRHQGRPFYCRWQRRSVAGKGNSENN